MLQFLHDGDFLRDSFTRHLIQTFLENLDGNLTIRVALPELDFASSTGAYRVEDSVLSDLLLFAQVLHIYEIKYLI